jgi:hypothetical protein
MRINVLPQLPRYAPPPPFLPRTRVHHLTQRSHLQKKADLELAEARKAEKAARSYDSFLNAEVDDEEQVANPKYSSVREMEEDFM